MRCFLEAIMEARGNIKLGRCEGVKGMLIGKKDLDAGSRGSFRKTVVVIGSEHYCCAAGGNLGCCVLSLEVLNLWVKTLPRGAYWISCIAHICVRIPNSRKITVMK